MTASFVPGTHGQVRSGIRGIADRLAAKKAAEAAALRADKADRPLAQRVPDFNAKTVPLPQAISVYRLAKQYGHLWAIPIQDRPNQPLDIHAVNTTADEWDGPDGMGGIYLTISNDRNIWHRTCTGRTLWCVEPSGTVRVWFFDDSRYTDLVSYREGAPLSPAYLSDPELRLSLAEASCVITSGHRQYSIKITGRTARVPASIYVAFGLPVLEGCEG